MTTKSFKDIQNPEKLRKLSPEMLQLFADELRQEIINILAKGEGHLGSKSIKKTIQIQHRKNNIF